MMLAKYGSPHMRPGGSIIYLGGGSAFTGVARPAQPTAKMALVGLMQGRTSFVIAHRLSTIRDADTIIVMDGGRIVEQGAVDDVLRAPRHPYTRALLSAVPQIAQAGDDRRVIERLAGDLPSPSNPPVGCHFHPRCAAAAAECRREYPAETNAGATHRVRCFHPL